MTDEHSDPPEDTDTISPLPRSVEIPSGTNFQLTGDRDLARGWAVRARDNIAAILLSKELEQTDRIPTPEEQAQLLRFTGFGATELAQNCFRRPGEDSFRPGWEEIGATLEPAVAPAEWQQAAHLGERAVIRRRTPVGHDFRDRGDGPARRHAT